MKRIGLLFLGLIILFTVQGQVKLGPEAQISLLTSAPSDDEVYTLYGHAALRVQDPSQQLDLTFNYGIFDFSKPNFIYRFAKGETDYMLGITDFAHYIVEYQMRGSCVTEQVLNLTLEEKERIWKALLVNYQPENRVYRYNFFFDNCATRPVALVEKNLNGTVQYHDPYPEQTFRSLINNCTRNHPWLTLGCDLALGSPTDRLASSHEMMFLPGYLKEAFAQATVRNPDGSERKLVKETNEIGSSDSDSDEIGQTFFTPLMAGWLLFGIVFVMTLVEWRRKTYFRGMDCLLFFIAGAGGIVLFFLSFISVHPCTCPNWNLVWLQPLHGVAVILFCVKKFKKAAYCYHFINFAALSLMLVGWHFIPQHLNLACIPLIITLWLRSGYGIYRKIWTIE